MEEWKQYSVPLDFGEGGVWLSNFKIFPSSNCLFTLHHYWTMKDEGIVILILFNFSKNSTFELCDKQKLNFVWLYEFYIGVSPTIFVIKGFCFNVSTRQSIKKNNHFAIVIWFCRCNWKVWLVLIRKPDDLSKRLGLNVEKMVEEAGTLGWK